MNFRVSNAPQRAVAMIRSAAAGAAVAQIWQAGASFVIQVASARLLGAQGLGTMALCLGVIVTGTGVTSGMVGDSLTVLDRHDPSTRAGLQSWGLIMALLGSFAGAGALLVSGVLDPAAAAAFFAAGAFFQLEELARRLLMVNMRFWHLVIVDTSALVTSVLALAVSALLAPISIASFLAAIAFGQAVGCVVGVALLPASERYLTKLRGAELIRVADFGVWRGAQVGITPMALTASRVVVIAAAGTAALGQLEAARIFVAPATLIVQGIGSYLLASYVRDRRAGLEVLVKRATTASLLMAGGAMLAGGAAAAAVGWAGPLLTGAAFKVSALAVFGWGCYAAASATIAPFASLAASQKRQRAVLACRVADSALGLSLMAVALLVLDQPVVAAPFMLAIGLVAGGFFVRRFVLEPLVRQTPAGPDRSVHQLLPVPLGRDSSLAGK